MELFIQQVLSGLASGAIYALMALAVVMIYQTIQYLNFAQGEMAMFSTFIAWQLMAWGAPYWIAFILTIAVSFLGGALIERIVFKPIRNAPELTHIVVFIALFAIFNSLAGFIWDFTIKPFPTPFGQAPLLASGILSVHQAGMIGVTALLVCLLYGFFRYTRLGLAMRAVAENPASARLVGIRVGWMTALGWGMAAAIGAVAGMLIAPVVFLEPNMMLAILLYGFAGAVLGGLTSPGGAVLGGLVVGVVESSGRHLHPGDRLGDQAAYRAFLDRSCARRETERRFRPQNRAAGVKMSLGQEVNVGAVAKVRESAPLSVWRPNSLLIALLLAVALVLPFLLKNFVIFQLTIVMIYAIAIMGLNLLTGFNGQFSLGHGAFFAIGAYTAAILMDQYAVSFFWTLPAAAIVSFAFGVLFGLPALRLENIYLALATFALAAVMPQLLKLTPLEHWTGGVQGISLIKPDAPFGLPLNQDQWLYFFTLAIAVLMYVLARNIVMSRSGRAIMAIRDNPIAARTMGINTAYYKTLTFGVSALYTGVAGALSAVVVQFVAPDSFTVSLSVALLVGLVIGGVGWLPGAFIGGAFVLFVPNIAEDVSKGLSGAVYGVILLLVVYLMPSGAGAIWRAAQEYFSRRRK